MEESEIVFFSETIAALGLNIACSMKLNELMKLSEYQNSRLFLTLVKGHSDFKVKCLTSACILR